MKKNRLSINKEDMYSIFFIVLVGISFIPLIILCFYNHPSADDYSYSIRTFHEWNTTHSLGRLLLSAVETSKHFWNTWQGLYSSAFFLSLQPAIFGEKYYFLTGVIMLSLIVFSTCYFFSYIIKKVIGGTILDGIAIGSAASFLMVQWMPSSAEGLYWYNGAVNYGLFYAVLSLLICSEISLHKADSKKSIISAIVICCLLGFLLEGGNHVTAFMGLLSIFCFVVLEFVLRKIKRGGCFVGIFLFMVTCFLINIMSPGTRVRQSAFVKMGVIPAIKSAISTGIKNINSWLDLAPIIVLLLMMPIILKLIKIIYIKTSFRFSNPLIVLMGSVAWICAMYCPPLYAMGYSGDRRLQNIVWYNFIVLFFLDVFYITGWVVRYMNDKYRKDTNSLININWLYCVIVLFVGLYLSKWNGIWGARWNGAWSAKAIVELKQGEVQRYSQQAFERYEVLLNSTGQDVEVETFEIKPETLFFDDITEDPDDWRNRAVRDTYDLKSIRIKKNKIQ